MRATSTSDLIKLSKKFSDLKKIKIIKIIKNTKKYIKTIKKITEKMDTRVVQTQCPLSVFYKF
jgi:TusA-related sulfurtransferase